MSERSLKRAHRRRLEAEQPRPTGSGTLRRAGIAAGAATAGAFALAAPAQAANFQVDVLTDGAPSPCGVGDCTLRDALTLATANGEADDITFLSSLSGTIRLTAGELPINDPAPNYPLNIQGPGASQLEVSGDSDDNGTGNVRVFNIAPDSDDVSISGLTLTEGAAVDGGAIFFGEYSNDLTLTNVSITNSDATGSGAGVFGDLGADMEIVNSRISGNDAADNGGGISASAALTVTNSEISNNTASAGGGGGGGGGIVLLSPKYSPLRISDSTITGNDTSAMGGGVFLSFGKYGASITDTTISGNTAALGGAGVEIGALGATQKLKINRSTISGNTGGPASFGGGIGIKYGIRGDFELLNSTVSGNKANVGGGVSFGSDSNDSILDEDASIELNNSTIADNSATSRGGGLYLNQYPRPGGGGNTSATIPLNSTIVADNTVGGTRQDLDRANGSGGGGFDIAFSLIERKGDAPLIQSPPGSNTLGVDPKLGNLRNNGGPTLTQKPAGSSKAVDHGDSSRLDTDQRGSPRRVNFGVPDKKTGNGTDIGAVELRRGEVPNAKCAGKLATIIGGSKVINGTKGRDIIAGTPGKNVIRGRGGRDILCGRGGRDRLIGGPGRDRLIGGPGRDRLLQ